MEDTAEPPGCTLVWQSGFENGFPGEFTAYDDGYWSADGRLPDGRSAAWTIVDRKDGDPVYSGDHAYKGWIESASNDKHRPYPVIHDHAYEMPLVNTFMVYLDVDYARLGDKWIHFGTWGNWNFRDGSGIWALHTMAVRNRRLELAHVEPDLGEYIGPTPRPDFPLRRWVRFTVYIHYIGASGFVQVWQDGVPMLRAGVKQLARSPGTVLRTAHWGLYAPAAVGKAVQYNDDIRLWRLDAPLTDLRAEPRCPD